MRFAVVSLLNLGVRGFGSVILDKPKRSPVVNFVELVNRTHQDCSDLLKKDLKELCWNDLFITQKWQEIEVWSLYYEFNVHLLLYQL